MRQYNLLQAIPMSFYSRKLYQDVAQNWGGMAILYLLFIVFLSWIPTTFIAQKKLNAYYSYNLSYRGKCLL